MTDFKNFLFSVYWMFCLHACLHLVNEVFLRVRLPGTEVLDGGNDTWVWKLNSGPLQQQAVLLTTESSLAFVIFKWKQAPPRDTKKANKSSQNRNRTFNSVILWGPSHSNHHTICKLDLVEVYFLSSQFLFVSWTMSCSPFYFFLDVWMSCFWGFPTFSNLLVVLCWILVFCLLFD